ncbi:MAG TPA: DNA translocase FtsK 4TM domain-containing protein [Microthrixaceae bacterium]|nr:DNA translocase FtsK 4TM domain-containing protein [Microthrixaceae bacterium]
MVLDGHGHDVTGVILVALGVISGFGIYASSAGPVGRGLAALIGAFVGVLRYLVPLGLVAGGILAIRGPRSDESETPSTDPQAPALLAIRRGFGVALLVLSVAGLLHLAVDPPSIEVGGLDAFAGAGGYVGAIAAAPLAGLVGGAGAAVVLVLVGLVSLSLLAGRSLKSMFSSVGSGSLPGIAAVGQWIGDLFRVGGHDDDVGSDRASGGEARVPLFDQDAQGKGNKDSTRKSRRRKPAEPTLVLPPSPPVETTQLEIGLGTAVEGSEFRLPPRNLLALSGRQEIDTETVTARGRQLEGALAEHGVQTRLVGMVVGPTVTRYELELGVGVKVNAVINLSRDIAYNMASPDVRIIAPIPGKQAIGVEVPNTRRQIVALGDILASPEAHRATHPLEVAVGRDIEGRAVMVNLATMPHILIAGQTGAGKSSCINSIMTSILMRATPDQVRLILIDPKRVELTQYNRVPHLLTQVVTNPKKAANALAWAVKEMERRYELLEEVGVRDVTGYNSAFDRGELVAEPGEEREYQRLPYVLVVVDELADLMMVAARDVEESINRIAAKARAVGVHLVIATQRPSVNVITGVIKANIPARFAFSVASATDSKVILDQGGAERLVGKGDMLVMDPSSSIANRIQGCWVEEKEVHKIVSHWRRQAPELAFVEDVQGEENLGAVSGGSGGGTGDDDDDDLLVQAMDLVVRSQLGSTSMLQRKLKVGFARAGRIMDLLEDRGVVGPSEGSKARTVLMTVEELEEQQARA